MFTWICPVCGAEVPPSSSECPRCAERGQQPGGHAAETARQYGPPPGGAQAAAGPPPAQYQAPPPASQLPPPYVPPPAAPPAYRPAAAAPGYAYSGPQAQQTYALGNNSPRRSLPAWLVAALTVVILGGGLVALYKWTSRSDGKSGAAAQASPFEPVRQASSSHPYAKYLEVAGIRLFETNDKKPAVRFTVINHAPAELGGVALRISLETVNAAPGEAVVAVVEAHPGSIPANGSKEMESPLVTHLKMYELPDWQFIRPRIEITSPK